MAGPLTGRKVFAITVSAFAVIIAVNVTHGRQGGEHLSRAGGEELLRRHPDLRRRTPRAGGAGLDAEPAYAAGRLSLAFRDRDGRPVRVSRLAAIVGRPTEAADDRHPDFAIEGGDYVAPVDLAPGHWMILLEAFADDGTRFHQRLDLLVKG